MKLQALTTTQRIGVGVLIAALLSSGRVWATPFLNETVDATVNVGQYTSLALDAQGNPRISYFDYTNGSLRYASKSGGSWTPETVNVGGVGQYTSLALDAQGNPRISFYDSAHGNLMYASKSGGTWTIETVDSSDDVGQYTSLALDPLGNPHISYYDNTNFDLRYATKSGGSWTLDRFPDITGVVGLHTSLALDAQGGPRISYRDESSVRLKYVSKIGGVWTPETVDVTGNVGNFTSLALDAQGNPCISYSTFSTFKPESNLKYASKSGGVWTLETVDVAGVMGEHTSLALDAQGNPRISYWDNTNTNLKYASKSASAWTLETVDATGSVGEYTSLALDAQGNPRISYYDNSNGDLKYADSSVRIVSPSGGANWPVGALRTLTWSGAGTVDVLLSADGGATYGLLLDDIQGSSARNDVTFRVPHLPTRFARLEVRRASPLSIGPSDSLFTIQTSITLLAFTADPPSETSPGVHLTWSTNPGPEDLSGYRVERRRGDETWTNIVPLTQETSAQDPTGKAGSAYRLTAVNGLGEELVLGEVQVAPAAALAAWPLPYRAGQLTVSFATYGALGDGMAPAEVSVFDVAGRRIRVLASGNLPDGYHRASWDGKSAAGTPVSSGIYFVRALSGGRESRLKVVVVR